MVLFIVAALLAGYSYAVFSIGESYGSARIKVECNKNADERERAHDKVMHAIRMDEQAQRTLQHTQFVRLVNLQDEQKRELSERMRAIRISADGLRVSAQICRDRERTVSGSGTTASVEFSETGAEGTIRLSETTEERLYAMTEDAAYVVNLYESCRETLDQRVGLK